MTSSSSVNTPNTKAAAVSVSVSSSSNSSSSPSTSTKENNGESAKKRRLQRVFFWTVAVLVVFGFLQKIYYKHFSDSFKSEYSYDKREGKVLVNKRPERHYKDNYKMNGITGEVINLRTKKEKTDGILEGYLTLIDIQVHSLVGTSTGTDSNKYTVDGIFCKIDWKIQQTNPSIVSMFRDLKSKSIMCESTTIRVNLYNIVQATKKYDSESNHGTVSVIDIPNGVVFHETRCGSTLFANLLASFVTPQKTNTKTNNGGSNGNGNSRVYSESPPPVTALKSCAGLSKKSCNPDIQKQLIRDVFYMMGRSRTIDKNKNTPYHVFYKIQSIGVMSIDKFTMAFPDVPWVFVYRDSIEIMQSHMKNGIESVITGKQTPVCGRNYRLPYKQQPSTTLEIIQKSLKNVPGRSEYSSTIQKDLNIIEYCAAHIAGLSLSAIKEYERHNSNGGNSGTSTSTKSMGRFVNYSDMPEIVWNDILPNHFNIDIVDDKNKVYRSAIKNMENVALVYSKGRGQTENMEFKEDSTRKKATAPQEVIDAVKIFTKDTYNKMEAIS